MRPLAGALAAIAAIAASLALPTGARAHSWYSLACCSGLDCHPISPDAVQATRLGWKILETGEVIPYGDRREQYSQDSDFHRCKIPSGESRGRTRCLYVPGAGM